LAFFAAYAEKLLANDVINDTPHWQNRFIISKVAHAGRPC